MSNSKRRQLGLTLICVSVAAWIVALVFFSHTRTLSSGSEGSVEWIAISIEQDLGKGFAIPTILCGVAGVLLLAWPSRKPPELT
jgi:hypothetical protein